MTQSGTAFNPKRIAVEFYFGALRAWKIPAVAANALEFGFDGPALRALAGITDPRATEEEIGLERIDEAFREMGVAAPICRENAQIALAVETAKRAIDGSVGVFEAATHIRIYIFELSSHPAQLNSIIELSRQARHAPRSQWGRLERELRDSLMRLVLANPDA